MDPYDEITVSGAEGVSTVTIDMPKRRNALSDVTMLELTDVFGVLGSDPSVRAIVLTGNGAFCAGVDVRWLNSVPPEQIDREGVAFYDLPQGMIRALLATPVPVVAAVDGPAVGVGMDLALACDCRFIGDDGSFTQGWARAGLVPATGGVHLLHALAPSALWSALTQPGPISKAHAVTLNIAEAADGSALSAAQQRAGALAAMNPSTVRGYVRLSRDLRTAGLDRHLADAARIQLDLFREGKFRDSLAAQLAR
jgi:2-(1,2-epoxy-1,2-dihydrophenyl)acetyl-CoA isomerase